ncbi:hypothetical protein [Shouchella miscanthi]|uniref:Uncharacterized protein n=1 Tax=Shouchella miscanthi TaxID=2598861 RepID=A0ABU6NSF5_9BACI|nr:hypothetical protein [Shouchella miscanthi]
MSDFKCTECGSTKVKTGKLSGYARITRLLASSNLIATFCGNCGHVDAFKVEKPRRF